MSPRPPLPGSPGTYVILLHLSRSARIRVGRLGEFPFRRGWYAYVGSAFGPGGLAARLERHLRTEKKLRWHIDYLRALAQPRSIWFSTAPQSMEHAWAMALSQNGAAPIAGFGCSDCRCPSHLYYFTTEPSGLNLPGSPEKHRAIQFIK